MECPYVPNLTGYAVKGRPERSEESLITKTKLGYFNRIALATSCQTDSFVTSPL
jgi:hypothetical protein